MRILFRHLDPGQAGSVTSIMKLLEAYCARFPGDEVTVLCVRTSPLRELARLPNCRVEPVSGWVPRETHLLLGDLAVWRRREAFDVFWAVNLGCYLRPALPQVLTVNNAYQVSPFSVAALHPRSRLRVAVLRSVFRRALRVSRAAVVQTERMRDLLRQIPGCPERVVVLPKAVAGERQGPPVALPEEAAAQLARADGVLKLLYVATAMPHKNHAVLAGMMDALRKSGRRVALAVTLSTEQWRAVAGPLAQGLVESGHVLPLGWVPKDALGELYARCDVCVMPSLLESLSSAHIEAMHWRRPQIVADLAYAHDTCGDAALYADPHAPAAWAAAVERLADEPALRESLVARGVQQLAPYPKTWTEMAERVRAVLTEVSGSVASAAR